jgi:adenosylcobyric acid synthase
MVTGEGAEIGRAQWLQAVAAGAEPEAAMNPVLLKPTSERSSQVILMGRPLGVQEAASYQRSKDVLFEVVDGALADLRARFDVVICEGAGSPAEINLLDHDIVNLGLARRAGIPAVVVGDIHRGGVFAHLFGTVAILPDELRASVVGFIINMFRGDPDLLGDAMDQLEARCGVPTLGVLPYLPGLVLDAEDSLHQMLGALPDPDVAPGADRLDVAVLRLPRLSNFTDVDPLTTEPGLVVRFVDHPSAFGRPDLVILPGTKSTVADLQWLRASGLLTALEEARRSAAPPVVLGICGGFQMLGQRIDDPEGVESSRSTTPGLGWLPLRTGFTRAKTTTLRTGTDPSGHVVRGYEIRHGQTEALTGARPWLSLDGDDGTATSACDNDGLVWGTSLHGLFEEDGFRSSFLAQVAAVRGLSWRPSGSSFAAARERQIDRVADACAAYLDTDALWRLVERGALTSPEWSA